jgi:hypothetical protein
LRLVGIVVFTVTTEQLHESTGQNDLEPILRRRHFTPKFISVTRSAREGYTVRNYQAHTEHELLGLLKKAFPKKVVDHSIFYDRNLLDGKAGWQVHRKATEGHINPFEGEHISSP